MIRFTLSHPQARTRCLSAIAAAPEGAVVTIREGEIRSLDANAALWGKLSDVAAQVEWYGKHLCAEDWKCIFTAALLKSQVVPGIDGGFVVVGQSTSRMSKKTFSDLLELITAFGAERGVRWSDGLD